MELTEFSFWTLDGFTLGSLLVSLLSAAVLWFLSLLLSRFSLTVFGKRWRAARIQAFSISVKFWPRYAFILLAGWLLVLGFERALRMLGISFDPYAKFLAPLLFVLIHSLTREWRFNRLGLAKPEKTVESGTDYRKSLSLCTDKLDFLGTAASKLTSLPEFADTLKRCNRRSPNVRLLLMKPEAATFEHAEKRAAVEPNSYRQKLYESLRALKRLRDNRHLSAEVRFYLPEKVAPNQPFRMMFIDDRLLLLSFNVYGEEGDGRQQPQIVIHNARSSSGRMTFYRPFRDHFEALWEDAEAWDYDQYATP